MKVTFTFEFDDLLGQIVKLLSMSGVKPLLDADDKPCISFDSKKKEVTVQCEAAPVPTACPFCTHTVNTATPTQQDSKTTANTDEPITTEATTNDDDSQANNGEEKEDGGEPMTLAQIRAQSNALSRKVGPIKVQRGAEAHAALATTSRLEGESSEPPFGGGGD